jgi:acetoin utilization deacetylase AcuC-like enzyme
MDRHVSRGDNDRMKRIPVFFSSRMVCAQNASFSPSAGKPAAVVASWKRLGVPLAWHAPAPATRDELALAHDGDFVDDVLACRRKNGFDNTSAEVAATLPWTTGAMLSAARYVLREKVPVAAAPCSGFHHATWSSAGGFCTFNGLMVTAAALHAEGASLVGIVDCDMHYGDGTDDIIEKLDAGSWLAHFTAGARYQHPGQAGAFFKELARVLRSLKSCDVVLYQAGADPHIHDPLGGFLTTDELLARDRLVFRELLALGVPVVWNLAGGYQVEKDGSIPKVLAIHDNTMKAAGEAYQRL